MAAVLQCKVCLKSLLNLNGVSPSKVLFIRNLNFRFWNGSESVYSVHCIHRIPTRNERFDASAELDRFSWDLTEQLIQLSRTHKTMRTFEFTLRTSCALNFGISKDVFHLENFLRRLFRVLSTPGRLPETIRAGLTHRNPRLTRCSAYLLPREPLEYFKIFKIDSI